MMRILWFCLACILLFLYEHLTWSLRFVLMELGSLPLMVLHHTSLGVFSPYGTWKFVFHGDVYTGFNPIDDVNLAWIWGNAWPIFRSCCMVTNLFYNYFTSHELHLGRLLNCTQLVKLCNELPCNHENFSIEITTLLYWKWILFYLC